MAVDLGWNTGQTRIHAADGRLLGAGVLIGGRYVLTCSRAARDATEFRVGSAGSAALAGLVPPLAGARGDLALLELETPVRHGATLRRKVESGREIRIHSLPLRLGYGIWVRATTGAADGERVPLTLLEGPVDPDLSGCPAFDRTTGRLLGIVVVDHAVRLVPADTVLAYFPQLREWVTDDSVIEDRLDELLVRTGSQPVPGAGDLRVGLPKATPPDPFDAVLPEAALPERHRFCVECGSPVGRGEAGRPGRARGYCVNCGTPFTFLPTLARGAVVAGRYAVLGCIAHGGFSWIYLARDEAEGGRFVVLKTLIGERDRGGALAAAQSAVVPRLLELDHPNVVRTLAHVEHPDPETGRSSGYLVMEYVRGISLRTVFQRAKRLRPEHVAAYGLQLLEAVGYLHQQGLLYVDLKPDNVLQDGDRITLVDLGSVRRKDDRDSAIVGTPGYQPPRSELEREGISVRSDLYSVGRTLEELLRACSGPYGGLGREQLQELIDRATAGYEDRFATADDMAEQLRGVLRLLLSARTRVPHPAASRVFGESGELATAGLGAPGWEDWGPEPPLRADDRLLEDHLRTVLPVARSTAPKEVAAAWHSAATSLEAGRLDEAEGQYRRCTRLVQGELAPLLALGFCAELRGASANAARYYQAVWACDPTMAAAAFGLARTRLAVDDRVGAAAALDEVPAADRRAKSAARAGAVRALASIVPGEGGLPSLDEAAAAWSRLGELDLDEDERDRLTAVVGETLLRLAAEHPAAAGRLPDLRQVQHDLAQIYWEQANRGWPALREHAGRVRGLEVPRPVSAARPKVVVHYPRYLPSRSSSTTVKVTVTAGSDGGSVRLFVRDSPGCVVYRVSQLAPRELSKPLPQRRIGEVVLDLGHWAAGEIRDYALSLLVPSGLAIEREHQLVAMWAQQGAVQSEAETVSVLLTDDPVHLAQVPVGQHLGLGAAVDAALSAHRNGNLTATLDALGAAVALATAQGNEAVLGRLRWLVDIVDAESGLVSLRGLLAGDEFLSERISVPSQPREPVAADVEAPAEEDYEVEAPDSAILGAVSSVRVDSRRVDSRRADSRRADSRRVDSRRVDSRRVDSRRVDSRPATWRTSRTGYPPPSEIAAMPPLYSRRVLWASRRPPGAKPPDDVPPPGPDLLATVECRSDDPVVVGRSVRVAVSVRRKEPAAAATGVVRVRVLLDAVPGAAEPVSRIGWIAGDRLLDPAEFDVVPAAPGPLRLVFRIYREHDAQLLLEIAAALPVEVPS
ncbi:serine/threonine-protein kinase [Amycolatopsis dendrobii]|uniref:non-specific serine/threonine protein kinase n=1 Tax=Amycolatopsis dendrobii TaxID=2760662 RepID=A0A7W3VW70_9PSEU|nr:serine/threonine-protein kinase [Amycolatopsis dendrobii]MBB1154255.1 protein kinase [Amycolatopsis dendrobii]